MIRFNRFSLDHIYIITVHIFLIVMIMSLLQVFRVPMSYYKHIKVHSSVKPFFCTLCNYRAVRKDNVRQHVKKV